ncbi:NAD-dependent epimerase/dehydratase family protein, partial [bacterium]
MRVLLLGANGQLGSDIARLWNDPAVTLVHATRQDADVTDEALIRDLVERARPEVTINTTAFHNLPQCEQDPELAFRVNVV